MLVLYFCIQLLIRPRKFQYKTRQKCRHVKPWVLRTLRYGEAGLLTLQPLRLTSTQIFRFKLLLKKAVKKAERTKRFAWFNIFPHLPLTKKQKGSRMGKGVGKLATWEIRLRGGLFLFEFKNLRPGRSMYFGKQIAARIPTQSRLVFNSTKHIKINMSRKTNPMIRTFW